MDSFSRFTVPALKLDQYFDDISNSYYEGKFKSDNDGEVFKDYLEKYSAPIKESILVDDSPLACATFKALGGRVLQATANEDLTFHLHGLK
jgi:FMN phosphatase YigB (HAD superfamily)